MKAVVFASRSMGVTCIRRLLRSGFTIPVVFTHVDEQGACQPSGSVADLCRELSIACFTPRDPNQYGWIERIRDAKPDMLFSFAYRTALKRPVLSIPSHGCFALHESCLPLYRGPCPVNWAINRGERRTGVSLYEMIEKPYAGPIVAQRTVEITLQDTALSLSGKLEEAADALLEEVLPRMTALDIPRAPQDEAKASTFGALTPEDGRISWDRPADEIHNLIRALSKPLSGAFCLLGEDMLFFLQAGPAPCETLGPGCIAFQGDSVLIGTGYGCISPLEVEVNGRVLTGSSLFQFFKEHEADTLQ